MNTYLKIHFIVVQNQNGSQFVDIDVLEHLLTVQMQQFMILFNKHNQIQDKNKSIKQKLEDCLIKFFSVMSKFSGV